MIIPEFIHPERESDTERAEEDREWQDLGCRRPLQEKLEDHAVGNPGSVYGFREGGVTTERHEERVPDSQAGVLEDAACFQDQKSHHTTKHRIRVFTPGRAYRRPRVPQQNTPCAPSAPQPGKEPGSLDSPAAAAYRFNCEKDAHGVAKSADHVHGRGLDEHIHVENDPLGLKADVKRHMIDNRPPRGRGARAACGGDGEKGYFALGCDYTGNIDRPTSAYANDRAKIVRSRSAAYEVDVSRRSGVATAADKDRRARDQAGFGELRDCKSAKRTGTTHEKNHVRGGTVVLALRPGLNNG